MKVLDYNDNMPNAYPKDMTPTISGSSTIDAVEMDYNRFSGGGFNKYEFPLTIAVFK